MKIKQAILEDYDEYTTVDLSDLKPPQQKYIHFWDFMELDFAVHEFQARMGMALRDIRHDIKERYRNYYTNAVIQSPERFMGHARELREMEYMLENPFFLAILNSALKRDVDERKLKQHAISYKKRLMDRRLNLKENLEKEIKARNELLVR